MLNVLGPFNKRNAISILIFLCLSPISIQPVEPVKSIIEPITRNIQLIQQNIEETISASLATVGFKENQGQLNNQNIHYFISYESLDIAFYTSKIQLVSKMDSTEYSFFLEFLNANAVDPIAKNPVEKVQQYFIGGDQVQVRQYIDIWYYELYPGIDLHYYMSEQGIKYDFIVKPYANPNQITIQPSMDIDLQMNKETITFSPKGSSDVILFEDFGLYTFQDDGTVGSKFIQKEDNAYGYWIDIYDMSKELIIDPYILGYSTHVSEGSAGNDIPYDLKVDSQGNVYVAGYTMNPTFPTTPGVYDQNYNNTDVFIFKLSNSGDTLLASTFLGGTANDVARGIDLDTSGNVYVAGYTGSDDFPTTLGTFNRTFNAGGNLDSFISKLTSDLSQLLYSTYIGGSDRDDAQNLVVDDMVMLM